MADQALQPARAGDGELDVVGGMVTLLTALLTVSSSATQM
jgi:hypothetical protein